MAVRSRKIGGRRRQRGMMLLCDRRNAKPQAATASGNAMIRLVGL